LQRVCTDPADARAVQDLRSSLEQAARLHPSLAATLEHALGEHPSVVAVDRLPAQR
jgi:hypothetical protein